MTISRTKNYGRECLWTPQEWIENIVAEIEDNLKGTGATLTVSLSEVVKHVNAVMSILFEMLKKLLAAAEDGTSDNCGNLGRYRVSEPVSSEIECVRCGHCCIATVYKL